MLDLPELDKKATQRNLENMFQKYRIFKHLNFDRREASATAGYDDIGGGGSNLPSDQTGNIAAYNADQAEMRRKYIGRIEEAVDCLPDPEKEIIQKRYLAKDAEYLTDYETHFFNLTTPISEKKYRTLRWRAFYKLAIMLGAGIEKVASN